VADFWFLGANDDQNALQLRLPAVVLALRRLVAALSRSSLRHQAWRQLQCTRSSLSGDALAARSRFGSSTPRHDAALPLGRTRQFARRWVSLSTLARAK